MPMKCCVPNCKGNKDSINRCSVFSLPKCERSRQKWIRAILREEHGDVSFSSKNARVCEKHFKKEDIIRADVTVIDGKEVGLPRLLPKLRDDAVPCIFPNLPTYLTKRLQKRKPPPDRQETVKKQVTYPPHDNNINEDMLPVPNQQTHSEETQMEGIKQVKCTSHDNNTGEDTPSVCNQQAQPEETQMESELVQYSSPPEEIEIEDVYAAEYTAQPDPLSPDGPMATIQKLREKIYQQNKVIKRLKTQNEELKTELKKRGKHCTDTVHYLTANNN